MSHKEVAWNPKGATELYNGFVVWDHGVHPNESNEAEVDGDVKLTE